MKLLLTIALFAFLATTAMAEDTELNKAFQSEYIYLVSQKETLQRQNKQMQQNFADRINQARARVNKLQKDVVGLTTNNDEMFEELATLEKQKKELQKRGTSLESTYKKASKLLTETDLGLHFRSSKEKTESLPPADLKLASLTAVFEKADQLLRSSQTSETFDGVYLDSEERLTAGEVTRVGRIAAFVKNQDGRFLLGPNGAGSLKVLDKAEAGIFYVFDNLSEAARIQKPPTWLESLADMGPILFLGLMLAMVAGLFTVLVKI